MFFGADYSQQHCPLWSAALPTIVGSIADHRQHQKMYGQIRLDSWILLLIQQSGRNILLRSNTEFLKHFRLSDEISLSFRQL